MAVTVKFVPDRIGVLPNVATSCVLRLYNDDDEVRQVTLTVADELHDHVQLDQSSITLENHQIVDVIVTIEVPSTLEAGTRTIAVEGVVGSSGTDETASSPLTVSATATVDVSSHHAYDVELAPAHSRGSSAGRHRVKVTNTGNTPLTLALAVVDSDDGLRIDVSDDAVAVLPGAHAEASVRAVPAATYWSGPKRSFEFSVRATSDDGRSDELSGMFEQRPRVPNWLGPAAAGMLAALVVSSIAWFALLRPWVDDTAERAAADAIELDRAALRDRIDQLDNAAAEAKELPLGTPTDIRLDVAPTGGNSEQATATPDTGTTLSITDLVFQNPSGAVGTVSLRRGDDLLLQSELANFRDFDLHFVAPYVFGDDEEIVLDVECRTPGAGQTDCPVGMSLVGFVDENR